MTTWPHFWPRYVRRVSTLLCKILKLVPTYLQKLIPKRRKTKNTLILDLLPSLEFCGNWHRNEKSHHHEHQWQNQMWPTLCLVLFGTFFAIIVELILFAALRTKEHFLTYHNTAHGPLIRECRNEMLIFFHRHGEFIAADGWSLEESKPDKWNIRADSKMMI